MNPEYEAVAAAEAAEREGRLELALRLYHAALGAAYVNLEAQAHDELAQHAVYVRIYRILDAIERVRAAILRERAGSRLGVGSGLTLGVVIAAAVVAAVAALRLRGAS